jgi:hypothetical protein
MSISFLWRPFSLSLFHSPILFYFHWGNFPRLDKFEKERRVFPFFCMKMSSSRWKEGGEVHGERSVMEELFLALVLRRSPFHTISPGTHHPVLVFLSIHGLFSLPSVSSPIYVNWLLFTPRNPKSTIYLRWAIFWILIHSLSSRLHYVKPTSKYLLKFLIHFDS